MTLTTLGVYANVYGEEPMTIGKALLISLIGILVVFVVLSIIAIFVKILGTVFDTINSKKKAPAGIPAKAPSAPAAAPSAPAVKAETKLVDVTDEQAAIIMAIVSDKTGIPLNHLKFNSIKPVEEKK